MAGRSTDSETSDIGSSVEETSDHFEATPRKKQKIVKKVYQLLFIVIYNIEWLLFCVFRRVTSKNIELLGKRTLLSKTG